MINYISNNSNLITSNLYRVATIEELLEFLDKTKVVGVDTETEGMFDFKNRVIMLQIGNKDTQFVIDVRNVDVSPLKAVMENSKWLKIFHNAKFDLKFLKFSFGWEIENIYDTFLNECVLTSGIEERSLGLDALVQNYCNYKLNKEIRNKFVGQNGLPFNDMQIKYGAEDVIYLEDIMEIQKAKLFELELLEISNLENKAVSVFSDIEYNGMGLDVSKWLEIAKKTYLGTKEQERVLDNLVLTDSRLKKYHSYQADMFNPEPRLSINWSSSTQVLPILKAIGLPVESTSERDILKFQNKSEIVKNLLKYKKQSKLCDAFGESFLTFINPETDRIHANYWQCLHTGRVSCSEPNLLQIPSKGELGKEMRSAFVARNGYKIVGGDYSGAELRLLAEFSKDPMWVNALKSGKDLHSELASVVFNIPLSEVKSPLPIKPDITYRDVQKVINFGLSYGMTAYKLSDTLSISKEEAQKIIDKFFKAVPKVEEFLTSVGNLTKKRGYIRSGQPYGRIRWFDGYDNKNDFIRLGEIERGGKNHTIQASNADFIKEALIRLRDIIRLNNYPVYIINSIYDEILTECKEDFAEEWKEIMDKIMIEAAQVVLKEVPVVVDCSISDYWKK